MRSGNQSVQEQARSASDLDGFWIASVMMRLAILLVFVNKKSVGREGVSMD